MNNILIINGPNLRLTGIRESLIYGNLTLPSEEELLADLGLSPDVVSFQTFTSDHEGEIVESILNAASQGVTGIVINPGGYTHSSVSIADSIRASGLPVVEVHLSHIYAREEFRRHNLIASVCVGSISGFGVVGYNLAVRALIKR